MTVDRHARIVALKAELAELEKTPPDSLATVIARLDRILADERHWGKPIDGMYVVSCFADDLDVVLGRLKGIMALPETVTPPLTFDSPVGGASPRRTPRSNAWGTIDHATGKVSEFNVLDASDPTDMISDGDLAVVDRVHAHVESLWAAGVEFATTRTNDLVTVCAVLTQMRAKAAWHQFLHRGATEHIRKLGHQISTVEKDVNFWKEREDYRVKESMKRRADAGFPVVSNEEIIEAVTSIPSKKTGNPIVEPEYIQWFVAAIRPLIDRIPTETK